MIEETRSTTGCSKAKRSMRKKDADSNDEAPSSAPNAKAAAEQPAIKITDKRAASKPSGDGDTTADTVDPEADVAGLTVELRSLEQKHAETLDRLTRTHADFANFRRRSEAESRELVDFANRAFAVDLLRVLDAFDRAFAALPASLRSLAWIDGIVLTSAQLAGVLEGHGVARIECAPGDALDPSIHEVVASDDGHGPMIVVEEVQRGYRMRDRVLRPALVKTGPRPPEESDEAQAEADPGGEAGDQPAAADA